MTVLTGQTRSGTLSFNEDYEPNTLVWSTFPEGVAQVVRDQRNEPTFHITGITPGGCQATASARKKSVDGQPGEQKEIKIWIDVETSRHLDIPFVF